MHSLTTSLCVLASAALLNAAPASAAPAPAYASASASIDKFTFELIDLNLTDSITPAITFTNQSWNSYVVYSGFQFGRSDIAATGTTELIRDFGTGRGATSAAAVSSSSNLVRPTAPFTQENKFSGESTYAVDFTLTSGTGLRMSAVASVDVDVDKIAWNSYSAALAKLEGSFVQWDSTWSSRQTFTDRVLTNQIGSATFDLSGYLFTQDTARSGTFAITASTTTYVDPIPAPIPEPSTYAMLLAGAAIVAAKRGRKRHTV